MRAWLVVAVFVSLVTSACAAQELAAEPAPLRILLTNDDGYDTPGIKAVHEALVAAGHEVTLVAPLRNQSGSGMRVTTQGVLDHVEHSEGTWSVDGSPADSVLVGLLHIMQGEAPDIVISGANFGPNLGYASSSGTVGAATMAMQVGIPAIAVSVGIDPAEYSATPIPFPSTFGAFDGAAAFAAKLIRDLQETRVEGGNLLPEKVILNVNYPAVKPDELEGVRLLKATWDAGVRIAYEETGEARKLAVQLQLLDPEAPENDDGDWQWLSRRYVAITVLDGNTDAGGSSRDAVSPRLSVLEEN
ncbi:MAG: 5'/3'-nucleotidase SurE [Woeseiaceae bacterium]